jgi:hypothetical protein
MESFSPFPPPDKKIDLRFRPAVWVYVEPMYNENGAHHALSEVYRALFVLFWFPFFCWNLTYKGFGIHGYVGWKPIPVADDPAFFWRDLDVAKKYIGEKRLFVQLSVRGGFGSADQG